MSSAECWIWQCFLRYEDHWCKVGKAVVNMIQNICLLIHVFHNDRIYSTECYDPQHKKPSEGQQKYHMQMIKKTDQIYLLDE